MYRKIDKLEKKVKFLQVTIDKIKKWIWLKYEDQIPNEFLENVQNFDYNLVNTTNTGQLVDKVVGQNQIDIKEEIIEELIVPDLVDHDEMEHFFEPHSNSSSNTGQIEIDEKILPFDIDDQPSTSVPSEKYPQNHVPNINIIGQKCKMKRKRARKRLDGSYGGEKCDSKKTCKICGKSMRKDSLFRHMNLHKSADKWKHACFVEGCLKRFPVKHALMEHYRIHMNPHNDKYSEEFTKTCPQDILKYIENRKKSISKWWKDKGVEQYKVKMSKGEIAQALKDSCTVCGKTMTRKSLIKHMQIHTGTLKLRFTCTVENCPRKYSTINELNRHSLIHTDPSRREYSEGYAKICPQEVLKYSQKRNENKFRRINAKSVDCPTCGISMSELNLPRHNRLWHKDQQGCEEWNFPCQVADCKLKFPLKTALWEHYGVHLNRRNKIFSPEFKKKCPDAVLKFLKNRNKKDNVKARAKKACSICGKEVTLLDRHKRLVHDSEDKRFLCEICPWKFHLKDTLWTHYSVHVNPQNENYSEEFAKKCPQEILQFIEKSQKYKRKYNRTKSVRRTKKEQIKNENLTDT